MRKNIQDKYDHIGFVERIETPFTRDDYIDAIKMIEEQITTRMLVEAALGESEILREKNAEIAELRAEMNSL